MSLEQTMFSRNFEYAETQKTKDVFINTAEDCICEVYPNGEYQLVFANLALYGFLSSGKFSDINNEINFKKHMDGFRKSINIVKKGLLCQN